MPLPLDPTALDPPGVRNAFYVHSSYAIAMNALISAAHEDGFPSANPFKDSLDPNKEKIGRWAVEDWYQALTLLRFHWRISKASRQVKTRVNAKAVLYIHLYLFNLLTPNTHYNSLCL